MRVKVIGRQFFKRRVYISDETSDGKQFFKMMTDQIKAAGFPPYNFRQRLEFFKDGAKRILKKSDLLDHPHYYTKSEPDKMKIGRPSLEEVGNIKASHDSLESYVRAQGFEVDSPEDYAARVLDTINLIESGKDQEKLLDDAFHLGELVTRAYIDGFISKRSSRYGKRSGISRQAMKASFHKKIVDAAKSLLDNGWRRRAISDRLSERFDLTARQIRNILKKNGI